MAGNEDDKNKVIAEKAYEAAASSASEKAKASAAEAKTVPTASASPPAKPSEAKPEATEAKPAAAVTKTEAANTPKVSPAPKASPAKASAKPKEESPVAKAKPTPPAEPAAVPKEATPKPSAAPVTKDAPKPSPAVPAKAAPATPPAEITPVAIAQAKPTSAEPEAPVSKAAPKTAQVKPTIFAGLFPNFLLEEKTMDMSANFTGIHEAMSEAQAKAKAAFERGTAMLGEVTDFTKGNVEAVMESGKILADGMQGIGSEIVAEGRATFENISGDIKDLAAAKSPSDFFKIQGDMMRKNFDSAVAYGAKNSEAMLKLMSDAIAPISGRVSVAMDKVRQTSL